LLTDPKLRSQVDQLWDKLTGGLTNPLDAIEQTPPGSPGYPTAPHEWG
jgi:hypothetical protein